MIKLRKIYYTKTFQDRRLKVKFMSPDDLHIKTAIIQPISGVSTWNKNCNIGHISSYVIMAVKFRFDIHVGKFWQVRKSPIAFPSVCLSVRNFFETGHSFLYIFTKLDPSMHLCRLTMPIVFLGQRSNN